MPRVNTPGTARKLPFGLRHGRIVEPAAVANGLDCECICPGCARPLIAYNEGKIRTGAWFGHAPGDDCARGIESALHLAAKQLLADERRLMLPRVGNFLPEALQMYESVQIEAAFQSPADQFTQLSFFADDSSPERQARLLRADAICGVAAADGREAVEHWVEIFVHHPVDDDKCARLRRANKWALEVDLRWMLRRALTLASVREALQSTSRSRRWIAFPAPAPNPLTQARIGPTQSDTVRNPGGRSPRIWLGDGEETTDPELEALKARAQSLKGEVREREEATRRRHSAWLVRKYGYD